MFELKSIDKYEFIDEMKGWRTFGRRLSVIWLSAKHPCRPFSFRLLGVGHSSFSSRSSGCQPNDSVPKSKGFKNQRFKLKRRTCFVCLLNYYLIFETIL